MEQYLQQLRKQRQDGPTQSIKSSQPSDKLCLPGYARLITELRTNGNVNIKIELPTDRQIHMCWVSDGLLFFTPSINDPSYAKIMNRQSDEVDKGELIVKERYELNNEFGDFKKVQLCNWKDGADAILKGLATEAKAFLEAVNMTFKMQGNGTREIINRCLRADAKDINRQMRFIAYGFISKGKMPPIQLYQFAVTRMSSDIICEGAAYRDMDVTVYGGLRTDLVASFKTISYGESKFTYISHLKRFNMITDVWCSTACSVLISSAIEGTKSPFVDSRINDVEKISVAFDFSGFD
nr:MAG: hypothetical protein [Cypovirus sp.]